MLGSTHYYNYYTRELKLLRKGENLGNKDVSNKRTPLRDWQVLGSSTVFVLDMGSTHSECHCTVAKLLPQTVMLFLEICMCKSQKVGPVWYIPQALPNKELIPDQRKTCVDQEKLHSASPCEITFPSNAWLSAIISQIALKFM